MRELTKQERFRMTLGAIVLLFGGAVIGAKLTMSAVDASDAAFLTAMQEETDKRYENCTGLSGGGSGSVRQYRARTQWPHRGI